MVAGGRMGRWEGTGTWIGILFLNLKTKNQKLGSSKSVTFKITQMSNSELFGFIEFIFIVCK